MTQEQKAEDERIRIALIDYFDDANKVDENPLQNYGIHTDKIISWLKKHGKEEYTLKSSKEEDVRKFMQYIEKQAKAYEINLPNRSYDIYAFTKDTLSWLEKQSEPVEVNPTEFDLEKQGELKLVNKVEPKFKVGNWITNGHATCQITFIDSRYWYSETCVLGNVTDIDKTFHLWTIEDAKDGDVLVTPNQSIFIFKEIKGATVYDYCGLYSNRFWNKPSAVNGTIATELPKDYVPATKEQCELLFQKMKEEGCEWDADKKELKKILRNYVLY